MKNIKPVTLLATAFMAFANTAWADPEMSPEVQQLDLSGGCQSAQSKGARYANSIAQASIGNPSVCASAKANRKLGEVTVRIAESCKELPNWNDEKQAGIQMIEQSDQTISGSCQ